MHLQHTDPQCRGIFDRPRETMSQSAMTFSQWRQSAGGGARHGCNGWVRIGRTAVDGRVEGEWGVRRPSGWPAGDGVDGRVEAEWAQDGATRRKMGACTGDGCNTLGVIVTKSLPCHHMHCKSFMIKLTMMGIN
jgi:hypothetical protein